MNRDELLKKCVDRGVADEASIESVSHLFYMYLLTALQKGQRVEVPNFGTFGTRVVGVKRSRRMPFFEVEKELADKVNERYRDLKYLVVGRYELTPVLGSEEYQGKESLHETVVEQVGKAAVVDPHRDVTIEEYERTLSLSKAPAQPKEKHTMPKLNLKDEGMEETPADKSQHTEPAPPRLRESDEPTGGPSSVIQILVAILLLGAITFGLNYFGVIHLWGPKTPKVVESTLPEPEPLPPAVVETPTPEVTPTPTPAKPEASIIKPSLPASSGTGNFTVQVSSWVTRSKANEEVARLNATGLSAFVSEANVAGETWYRVRVGRYATQKEAEEAASQLQEMLENGIWVARMSS
ncbi:MAG: SPOR domain-containing protein [Bacteroidota bacterium]